MSIRCWDYYVNHPSRAGATATKGAWGNHAEKPQCLGLSRTVAIGCKCSFPNNWHFQVGCTYPPVYMLKSGGHILHRMREIMMPWILPVTYMQGGKAGLSPSSVKPINPTGHKGHWSFSNLRISAPSVLGTELPGHKRHPQWQKS